MGQKETPVTNTIRIMIYGPKNDGTPIDALETYLGRVSVDGGNRFPTRAAQNKGPAGSGRRGQVLWGSGEERGPRPSATRPIGSIRAGSLAAIRDFDCAFVATGFAGQRRASPCDRHPGGAWVMPPRVAPVCLPLLVIGTALPRI
jgi:hypothetical protein